MKRNGISMLMLIITIAVILILVGTISIGAGSAIKNARVANFAKNLQEVSEGNVEYYISNSSYALLEDKSYTYDEIKQNVPIKFLGDFEDEITKNDDTESTFQYLDINKIDISNMKIGYKSIGKSDTEKQSDVFVISLPNENIYYLKGIKGNDKQYFSLANISDNQKVSSSTSKKAEVLGITYSKKNKGYTNSLGLSITVNMKQGEVLYFGIDKNKVVQVPTSLGDNTFEINNPFNVTIGNSTYSLEHTNTSDYFVVTKKDSSLNDIGSVNISIKNYDTTSPIIDKSSFEFSLGEEVNRFSFNASDEKSQVKYIKYEYLKKFDENANEVDYFDSTVNIDKEYMKNVAKTFKVKDNMQLEIPRNISKIAFCVVDGAGNYSDIITTNTYSLTSKILPYVGVSLDSKTTYDNYIINISAISSLNIDSFDVAISTDGKNYGNVNNIASNYLKKNGNITTASISFSGLNTTQIYVKTVVNSTSKITVIDKLSIQNDEYTNITKKITADKLSITIPAGFAPVILNSDGSVNKILDKEKWNNKTFTDEVINQGVVVVDTIGNEYVWIPCSIEENSESVVYKKYDANSSQANSSNIKDDSLPSGITSEKDQIKKYGGFYVARYEASLPDTETKEDVMTTKIFNASTNNRLDIGKPQSKKNKVVWDYISYTNAKKLSENVISTNYVQSGLITGTQWDTMCKFIEKAGFQVTANSTSWGNYNNSYNYTITGYYKILGKNTYERGTYKKSSAENIMLLTGSYATSVKNATPNNLFDVAGNSFEYCTEIVNSTSSKYNGNIVARGGSYVDNGNIYSALFRFCERTTEEAIPRFGFRFVLYIK